MARPLDLVVEEMLDYIEQAVSYVRGMTFEQYSSDRKTQRAVERRIEVISERRGADQVYTNCLVSFSRVGNPTSLSWDCHCLGTCRRA